MNTYFYYGEEQKDNKFLKLPKVVMNNRELSNNAKLLYAVLLDRNSLSLKNEWKDKENKIYIYFPIEEIMEVLSCSKSTAIKALNELKTSDLVEQVKRGLGKVARLYVKKAEVDTKVVEFKSERPEKKQKKYKIFFCRFGSKKWTLRGTKNTPQEVEKVVPHNKTKESKTDRDYNLSIYPERGEGKIKTYEKILKENIEYGVLKERFGEEVDGYVSIMLDVMMSNRKSIAGVNIQLLKSQFMKLTMEHVQYVIWSMQKTKTQIKDIYSYIVKTLYQAPMTYSQYYTALFNYHDPIHIC